MSADSKPLYVYFGHHRCASTWILLVLMSVCDHMGIDIKKFAELNDDDLRTIGFIADTNAEQEHIQALRPFRGFHVIRDPRDIVVSAYFSHKYSHPMGEWLKEQRELLNQVNLEEGIKYSINFRSNQFNRMGQWNYHLPNIYETKFEILTCETYDEFSRIFRFLGLLPQRLSPRILEEILRHHSFKRLTEGRERGQEDSQHHYRKGIQGDWVKYFSEENKKYFKRHFGQMLIDLGYEKNSSW